VALPLAPSAMTAILTIYASITIFTVCAIVTKIKKFAV
jgi:hypothetical protein